MSIQNPVLKQFLNLIVSPERADVLSDVADFLSEIGDEVHAFAVESILSRFDNEEPANILTDIQRTLTDRVGELLNEHGVSVAEYSLPEMAAMLKTLVQIPNYGDPQELLDLINSSDTPETALAELTERFTTYHWVDVIDNIGEVKYSLIENMQELLQRNIETLLNVGEGTPTQVSIDLEYAINERRSRLRVFVEDNADDYIVINQIKDGMSLNEPLSYYVEAAHARLSNLDPKDCTQQLIAMAYASDLVEDDIQMMVKEYLEEFMPNITQMTKANHALESVLGY